MENGWLAALAVGIFSVLVAIITGIFTIRGNRKEITNKNNKEHRELKDITNKRGEENNVDHMEIKTKLTNLLEIRTPIDNISKFVIEQKVKEDNLGNSSKAMNIIQNSILELQERNSILSNQISILKNNELKLLNKINNYKIENEKLIKQLKSNYKDKDFGPQR